MREPKVPMTPAERQRAFRQRQKKTDAISLPQVDIGEDDGAEVSIVELNARMRRMAMRAFDEVGGVEFLNRVARKSPNTFLRFVGQFVTREDTINPAAYQFFIQQVNIEAAQPVRGVIASPVTGHIGGSRLIGAPGEVIEEQLHD